MEKISTYISYEEAVKTHTGINNVPDTDTIKRMQLVASVVFDKVREHFGKPIGITSFYRSALVNRMNGGSATSQHVKGEAIDIDGDVLGQVKNSDIFNYIRENLTFDQLIWEFGSDDKPDWVHVSYKESGNRGQVLRSFRTSKGTIYKPV